MHNRVTVAKIKLDNLAHNLRHIQRLVGTKKICAAVKCNAYGHGAVEVSRHLIQHGVSYLGVATLDEALELRMAHIDTPIIIYSYVSESEIPELINHNLQPMVGDIGYLKKIDRCARHIGKAVDIHLKIDSGMGRIGFLPVDIESIIPHIQSSSHITVHGIATHLADASHKKYTERQLSKFSNCIAQITGAINITPIVHAANSSAIIAECYELFDMVRPGIMLYGYHAEPATAMYPTLLPVMELQSQIIFEKTVPQGTAISYGMTWRSNRTSRIATVPIGYGDGYNRLLSNCGTVVVRDASNQQCSTAPIVGRVCMDQLMVDVTDIPYATVGSVVTLFGDAQGIIGADAMAKQIDTISYEVLTNINQRVRRIFCNDE